MQILVKNHYVGGEITQQSLWSDKMLCSRNKVNKWRVELNEEDLAITLNWSEAHHPHSPSSSHFFY